MYHMFQSLSHFTVTPLEYKLHSEQEFLSALFIPESPEPGAQQELRKYLGINEWRYRPTRDPVLRCWGRRKTSREGENQADLVLGVLLEVGPEEWT